MKHERKFRFFFWHKLLIALGGAMIFLALALTLTAMISIKHAGTEIGVKGKEILASQTERFLSNIVTGQSDTIDLQLDRGRLVAIHAATTIQNLIKSGSGFDREFLARLLANAGSHCTTIFYATVGGRVVYYPYPERDDKSDKAMPYSFIVAYHFSDFPDKPRPNIPTLWSDVHRNPYSDPYDRVVDALAPVYAHGRLAGYVGVSISVIRLVSQFNQRQTIRGSYTFLIDNFRGLVSGPPHATFELAPKNLRQSFRSVIDLSHTDNEDLDAVFEDMVLGNSAVRRIDITGRSKYMAYRPLARTGWSLGLAVPEALATAASEKLVAVIDGTGTEALTRMALTTLFFLGLVLVVVGLVTRRMTRPLLQMVDATGLVAKGELEHEIHIASNDEIGELAHSFNIMTRQLQTYIGSIKQKQTALHESETRYRALFENSPISLWEEDFSRVKRYLDNLRKQGVDDFDKFLTENPQKILHCAKLIRIVDINEATMEMYGAKTKAELLGGLPKVLTDSSMEILKKELVAIAEGRMFEIECTNQTLDGRQLTIVLRSLVPPGYEDSWRKVYVAINDITESKRAEIDKKRLEEQLRQAYKMEAIGTLAGGIAHDFNNILTAILGYTELLDNQPDLGEKNRRYTQQVLQAALRAKELVNQILAFSRQTEQVAAPVSVKTIVNEAVKLLRASLPTTIEIHQELRCDGVVLADSTQVHQVVMNLCTNAGQAMQTDGGVLTIRLNELMVDQVLTKGPLEIPEGNFVKLQIEDTGHGMSAETLSRIFDPFFTTKGRHQGTGMGLAVVHGIIQSYGGYIDVQSTLNSGTMFDVYLPLADAPDLQMPSPENYVLPKGTESILIVDDEPALADLGRLMLNEFGYHVTTFTNSLSALEAIKKSPDAFDLVITDMTMPNMTGDKLAVAIHEIDASMPIILCSGFSEQLDDLKNNDQINGFMMKPLDMNSLALIVRDILDERHIISNN